MIHRNRLIKSFLFVILIGTAFGAVSFSCTPATSDQKPPEQNPEAIDLSVMAYNVHHCNPPSAPEKIDVEAVVEAIRQQKPDLVALQEIDVNTGRSGNIDEARMIAEQLDMHYYFGKAIDHDGGEYGVAILSRFPISEEQTHALPTQEGTDGEPRVLATVKVNLPNGQSLRFGSTHLDAQREDVNRLLQIKAIGEIASTESLPMVIAGDFNAPPTSGVINILDQHFQRSCEGCAPTIPVTNPTKAIDFIAFRPDAGFEVVSHQVIDETYASDHRPVFSVLRVK